MKIHSIRTAALLTALMVAMFLATLIYFGHLWLPHWVALAVVTVMAVYYLTYYFIDSYIVYRIKPIYQMIYGKGHSSKQIQHEYSGKDIAGALDTEIKIWTESSQSEIKSLKVLEKYRKEFVGNVSHELKTPIFSLQGYISTLLDGGMDDPELVHRYLERSDKNIERLIMIVNDLEDISRLESGNLVLYKSTFDMVALVREVAEDMENLIIQSGSKLEITGAERAPQTIFVVGDRGRLEQVMTNLISNAV
ncbi:MAG: HAMP domain-containing sensor histidine kinase, partial [Mucinivorans sp.]